MSARLSLVPEQPTQTLIDADAEREVLGCAMCALSLERAAEVLALVPDEDWAIDRHRDIARAMRAVVASGSGPEVVAVAQELQRVGRWEINGGARCLGEVLDRVGTVVNAEKYAAVVRLKARARRMVALGLRLQTEAQNWPDSVGEMASVARVELEDYAPDEPEVSHVDALRAYVNSVEQPVVLPRLKTGIAKLDEHCNGGLARGWLVVIQAAGKVGKTVLAANNILPAVCGDMMHPGAALLVSLEMSREEHYARWLARETEGKVPVRAQESHDLGEWQWTAITGAADRVGKWAVSVDMQARSVAAIATAARRAKKLHNGLDLVIVDGLTQVANPGMEGNRTADIDTTTRGLKALAVELDCCVVLTVHVDKVAAKGGKPGMYDARGSSGPANDANLLIVPFRDEENWERAGLRVFGRSVAQAELDLGTLRFDGARMTFVEA